MKLNINGCRSFCKKHGITDYVELLYRILIKEELLYKQ